MMSIQRHNYDALGIPIGPYVHAVAHQNMLYTSGLTAFGTPAEQGGIDDQALAIMTQLKLMADQQGSSLSQLIKVTIFVTDLSNVDKLRTFLFEYYGDSLPASSLVKVEALFAPSLLIEIEAIIGI